MIAIPDTVRRRLGYGLVAIVLASLAGYLAAGWSTEPAWDLVANALLAVTFSTVIVVSLRAAPRNGSVWSLAWAAVFGMGSQAADSVALSRAGFTVEHLDGVSATLSPADLGVGVSLAVNVSAWAWLPGIFVLAIHTLILFPQGRAVNRRWRAVAWVSGLSMAAIIIPTAWRLAPWQRTPYARLYEDEFGPAGPASLLQLVLMAAAFASLIHLVLRFRKSTGEERAQYRWVTWALGANAFTIFGFGILTAIDLPVQDITLLAIPISFGIAITKYRLFDIDLVISRSLMFVGLAGAITLIYAAVVVGIGALIGGSNTWLSVLATVIVAIGFEPARRRLQRWVNRIVYGRRATPYEVLSDLTGRLAETESVEGLLARMAHRLQEGTGADAAQVWLASGDVFRLAASSDGSEDRSVDGLDAIDGTVTPIDREGDLLGALSVVKRRGEALTPMERRLVEDLAGSAGLVLRRRRLDADLEETARELSASRRRLVTAQDVERRRLERELHIGPEQHVLGLGLGLAGAAATARREGTERTAAMIDQISGDARHAIDQIRSLAQGIYPPLLESEGLAAAIPALVARTPIDVRTTVSVGRRYSLPVEAAVYFSVSEALTNAAKHGEAPIDLRVLDTDDGLAFEVADSGPGFDPETVARGSGLANMADRLDVLGGELTVESAPGFRTVVRGSLVADALAVV